MRASAVIFMLVFCFALPASGQQQAHRGECLKLTNQIARYERDVQWARERDNDLWEQATLDHLSRLEGRRERLCPQYARSNPFEAVGKLVAKAAQVAASYFLMGGL